MNKLTVLVLVASPLLAQDCDAILGGDYAPSMNNATAVTAAANALINRGADVRVRVITAMNGPTLEAYERQVEKSCPSWQAADGGRKNNLVAVFLSVLDRKTGIYYGSQWGSALDSRWPNIEAQSMNPRFRDEDYAGGLVAGLTRIDSWIAASMQAQTVAPMPAPQHDPPIDWGAFLLFAYIVIGFAMVVSVVAWLSNRATKTRAKEYAEQTMLKAQQETTDLVAECSTGIIY